MDLIILNHRFNVSSYALKLLKGYFFYGLEDMEKYIQEIEFIKRIKHKHIIEYIDHFYDKSGCPCILTKYYQVYNLFGKKILVSLNNLSTVKDRFECVNYRE